MNTGYLNIYNIHIFLWLALMFFLSKSKQACEEELVDGEVVEKYSLSFSVLVFLPVFLMAAFGRPRSDTFLYLASYKDLPSQWNEIWKMVIASDGPGFIAFSGLIKTLFGSDERPFRVAIALVHIIPIILVFRKYSEDYWFSAYLFVASGMHVGWMMNGLRQFMAVTIVFSVTPWMLEKKYIRVILIILLASLFHRTALFMIPIVFIAQGEIWNWKTLAFSAVIVGMSLLFSGNIGLFNSFANTTGYSAEFAIEVGDNGTNPLRVLVNSIPMLLAFTFRDRLREENDGIINMCVNMSIITSGVYLLSMVTSGILTGRMTIYTSLYNLILLPYVIDRCFLENNVYILRVLTIVLYFVYFAVQWQLR